MSRRSVLAAVLTILAVAFLAPPALASYGPLWTRAVTGAPRLAGDGNGAWAVWAEDSPGGTSLMAQRYDRDGSPRFASPVAVVGATSGLSSWLVASDGSWGVFVAWKAGGTTQVERIGLDGNPTYAPVVVCSDATVAALRGAGATATPVQLAADFHGGVYVRSAAAPTKPTGDTLLQHVSSTGALALADPGLAVSDGTAGAMVTDYADHLFVLLGAPGRSGVAVQRFAPALTADWPSPVTPANPLVGPAPSAAETAVGLVGQALPMAVYRSGASIWLQKFSQAGTRQWLRPVSLKMSGAVTAAGDGYTGCYLAAPEAGGLRVQHVAPSGELLDGAAGRHVSLGAGVPKLGGAIADGAGTLSLPFVGPAGVGVVRTTFLGRTVISTLQAGPAQTPQIADDGSGGAYVLAAGSPAGVAGSLWHFGTADATVTLNARAASVTYGQSVGFAGYLMQAGAGIGGKHVLLRWTRNGGSAATAADVLTETNGSFAATAVPAASGTWTATVSGLPGGQVTSVSQVISVRPVVSLKLGHGGSKTQPAEIFSGSVQPAHPGARVLLQMQTKGTWRTFATGKLSKSSAFSLSWKVPPRTATYVLRVILPAHTDHAQGSSPVATLRIKWG